MDWRLARRQRRPESGAGHETQYGALPYRIIDGRPVFLMITSRTSGNWMFPKGGLISGKSPMESAAIEAYEEAGVRGEIGSEPVGGYLHLTGGRGGAPADVVLFPLHVTEQLADWPERNQRHRHWALLPEARRLLAHPDMARAALAISRQVLFAAQPNDTSQRIAT